VRGVPEQVFEALNWVPAGHRAQSIVFFPCVASPPLRSEKPESESGRLSKNFEQSSGALK
jgi:hypothetical protein